MGYDLGCALPRIQQEESQREVGDFLEGPRAHINMGFRVQVSEPQILHHFAVVIGMGALIIASTPTSPSTGHN